MTQNNALIIDIGNTNVVLAICQNDGAPLQSWRLKTDADRTYDEYYFMIENCLKEHAVTIKKCIVSSVVPSLTMRIMDCVHQLCGITPIKMSLPLVESQMSVKTDTPQETGADRLANAWAAKFLYKAPSIIFDMGTATSVSVLDKDGNFIGGAIAPGLEVSLDALSQAAAKLPSIDLKQPESVIAPHTKAAISSGFLYGHAGMIEGLYTRMTKDLGYTASLILTGGLSRYMTPILQVPHIYDADLTIKGLYHVLNSYQSITQKIEAA